MPLTPRQNPCGLKKERPTDFQQRPIEINNQGPIHSPYIITTNNLAKLYISYYFYGIVDHLVEIKITSLNNGFLTITS